MPKPTKAMVQEAQRGLDWRREYGRGGTEVGIARARDIVNERDLSRETIGRMASFFARHAGNKDAEGFKPGEDGYPSNGRIAWALWGGDPGERWARRILESEERMSNTMETKDFTFKMDDLTDEGYFTGYASTFTADSVGDKILPGAFKRTLNSWMAKQRPIPVLWQHKADEPIGATMRATEDERGLHVEGQLLMGLQRAREAFEAAKAGVLGGLSIGFSIPRDGATRMDDGTREIREVKLFEYSFVTFPANEAAILTGLKAAQPELTEIRDLLYDIKRELRAASVATAPSVDAPIAPASDTLSTLLADIRRHSKTLQQPERGN